MPNWCYIHANITGNENDIYEFAKKYLRVDPWRKEPILDFGQVIPKPDFVLDLTEKSMQDLKEELFIFNKLVESEENYKKILKVFKNYQKYENSEDEIERAAWYLLQPDALKKYKKYLNKFRKEEITPEEHQRIKQIADEYDWNIENWGVKWDSLTSKIYIGKDDDGSLGWIEIYMTTPWDFPSPVFEKLHEQNPHLDIEAYYGIEGGFEKGKFENGKYTIVDNDLDEIDWTNYDFGADNEPMIVYEGKKSERWEKIIKELLKEVDKK